MDKTRNFKVVKTQLILVSLLTLSSLPQAWAQSSAPLIKEIEQLNKDLSQQELSLSKLAHLKSIEKQLSEDVQVGLEDKNDIIHQYTQLTQMAQKASKDKSFKITDRIKTEFEKRKLSNLLKEKNQKVQALQSELAETEHKFDNLKKVFIKHDYETTLTISELGAHIEQLSSSLERNKPHSKDEKHLSHQQILLNQHSQQLSEMRRLKSVVNEKSRSIAHYAEELKLKNQSYDELVDVNQKLGLALMKQEEKINYLVKRNSDLKVELAQTKKTNTDLQQYALTLKKEAERQKVQLEGQIASIQSSNSPSRKRSPASLEHFDNEEILANFKKAKYQIEELSADQVKLSIDHNYLFESQSTKIGELKKAKLAHLITLYTEEFLNKNFPREIESIDFVGHASPRYNYQYVAPLKASLEAYEYNLSISLKRAESLALTLFSTEFGNFPNKEEFRQKVRIIGKSFSEPIKRRSPASIDQRPCGPFDCESSQRVEIIFRLGAKK